LILLGVEAHPRYPLIMVANRDEFHARPTRPAGFWPDQPHILAGRDERAGGTWMGVDRAGRVAALTNFRNPDAPDSAPRSRGDLPAGFLGGKQSAAAYLEQVAKRRDEYLGFHLLLWEHGRCRHYSNRQDEAQCVAPGVHGISNEHLASAWHKVRAGRRALRRAIACSADDNEALFELLRDEFEPDAADGPPMFIRGDAYGTRSSTVLRIDRQGLVDFEERRFDAAAQRTGRTRFRFRAA